MSRAKRVLRKCDKCGVEDGTYRRPDEFFLFCSTECQMSFYCSREGLLKAMRRAMTATAESLGVGVRCVTDEEVAAFGRRVARRAFASYAQHGLELRPFDPPTEVEIPLIEEAMVYALLEARS